MPSSTDPLCIVVPGLAQPQGSKRSFYVPKLKRAVTVDANAAKLKPWRDSVITAAIEAMDRDGRPASDFAGPLGMIVVFRRVRPPSHFRKDGSLTASAPREPVAKPDLMKLTRAVEDALTGIVYNDDSQIVCTLARKQFGTRPETIIQVMPALTLIRSFPSELFMPPPRYGPA